MIRIGSYAMVLDDGHYKMGSNVGNDVTRFA